MSILVRYNPDGLTKETYDKVSAKMQESDWPPDGLVLHVAFGDDGDLRVSEVWESQEQLEKFSEKLRPALEEAGVQMSGDPEFYDVHYVEK
jgi:hypothetical protein